MNQSKKPSRIGLFKRIPILWAAGFLLSIQVSAIEQTLPYQNPERSAEQRVDDLRARMTLREKAGQLSQYVGIEHIKEAEQLISKQNLMNSDKNGFYPGLSTDGLLELLETGEIGSFLHVVEAKEANEFQRHAIKSRLGIPMVVAQEIHDSARSLRGEIFSVY
jgi:beta-glucosidase